YWLEFADSKNFNKVVEICKPIMVDQETFEKTNKENYEKVGKNMSENLNEESGDDQAEFWEKWEALVGKLTKEQKSSREYLSLEELMYNGNDVWSEGYNMEDDEEGKDLMDDGYNMMGEAIDQLQRVFGLNINDLYESKGKI